MPDREKVIKALDCCVFPVSKGFPYQSHIADKGCEVVECPYQDDCDQMLLDALALLKEQEPRVLTLEEVQNACSDYVYLETSTGWLWYCIKDEGESNKYFGYFVYGVNEYFIGRWKEYGKTWRCWTAMPTDKQRMAVKWDDSD